MSKQDDKPYSIYRCEVCRGRGRVNYDKQECHGCHGKGYIVLDNMTGLEVEGGANSENKDTTH